MLLNVLSGSLGWSVKAVEHRDLSCGISVSETMLLYYSAMDIISVS